MLGLAVASALVFGTGMFFLPETPRWLIRGGHHEVAYRVLVRIRELADVKVEIEEIKASLAQQTEGGQWADLLRRQVRPALFVGLGLAIFQQITGINTVIYYAPKILQAAGFNSASGAILATVGVGVVNVAMTILAMFLVDRAGRRPLLLVGIAGILITLGVARLEFPHLKSVRTARLDRCDLPDGLCRFICDQPRTDLLALDRRDLSAKNSRARRRHSGHVQLGFEPDRFAHVSDIG